MRAGLPFAVAAFGAGAALVAAQQPDMAHIALTGKPGEVSVDFVSHTVNCSGYGVQFGLSPDKLTFVPSYNCSNFTTQTPTLSFLNQALLTGLLPNTTYYYITGSVDSREPWSEVYQFTYQPARVGGPVIAIYADFGYYNAESLPMLVEEALSGQFDYVIHAGDFAYNLEDEKGEIGNAFMRAIEPVASRVPYMVSPGNHEDMGETYLQYQSRFRSIADNAGKNSGSGTNLFYSFDIEDPVSGLVTHYVSFSSELWWSGTPAQQDAEIAFLKADLAKVDRTKTPWVVAFGHKLSYMDDTIAPPSGAGAQIWQILEDAGVDLIFAGHVHEYRRFLSWDQWSGAVDKNCSSDDNGVYTNPKYAVAVVTGAPGCQEVNAHAHSVLPEWVGIVRDNSVKSTNNYGYGKLNVVNATHAHWTWTTAVPHVNSTDPTFTDDLWVIQENHGPRAHWA